MSVVESGAFPEGFWWGAATASYQIEGGATEGGRGPSIWDTFSHTPGNTRDGDTGDVACDHYHRVPQDVALMRELGLSAYRLSVAWPRIQPTGTGWTNPEGVAFYVDLVDRLIAAGIEPVVTLYHWDLPQALQDAGGWANRATAYAFADYARVLAEALGDRVRMWTTLNEPWCSAYLGHLTGEHAPGHTDPAEALAAAHHLNLAHGLAARAIREVLGEETPVSVTLNLQVTYPATDAVADREAARVADLAHNEIWLGPMVDGGYDPELVAATRHLGDWSFVQDGDGELARVRLDAVGVNYYAPTYVRARDASDEGPSKRLSGFARLLPSVDWVPPTPPLTDMGWMVQASGLTDILLWLTGRVPGVPLLITENGAAYPGDVVTEDGAVHDPERVTYLHDHVLAVAEAIDRGADVRGYFAWSLMDNFEWSWGYSRRFGIVHVDYDTQVRTIKDSGRWWADLARTGKVPPCR